MGNKYEDFKKEREKLNDAKSAAKPNNEQIQAHARDTIVKARILLKEQAAFAKTKLKQQKAE